MLEMVAKTDVSVVITTYNRAQRLRRALEAVGEQEGSDLRYEVVVVDSNSTDATREVVESFMADGRWNLQFEARQGIADGRNAGILASHGPIVAFTDDEAYVTARRRLCWITTNAAFRRTMFERIGLFSHAHGGGEG